MIGFSLGKGDGVVGACKETERSGVFGLNELNDGIGWGVTGRCHSPQGAGVAGHSRNGIAVSGFSEAAFGVVGRSESHIGVWGIGRQVGVRGEGTGAAVLGFSPTGHGVIGIAPNNASFAGSFSGNVLVTGSLTVLGAKAAAVRINDGSYRRLYSMESPESWFEDFGEASLKNGKAVVRIAKDFIACIRRGQYHVFLTAYEDCAGLYVRRRGGTSFEVRELNGGKRSLRFSYRVAAKRKDVEGKRLERVRIPRTPEFERESRSDGSRQPPTPPDREMLRDMMGRAAAYVRQGSKVARTTGGAKKNRL